jgi:acetyl-CoA acyltransferase
MEEAVIVESLRTPLAKSFRGSLNLTRPDDQAAHCIRAVLNKVPQLDPNEVGDVVLGCGQPHGPAGSNIARIAALLSGLPTSVGGTTVNRFCSSGLQAIAIAAHQVMAEGETAVFGGGVESITMMTRDNSPNPKLKETKPGVYMAMGDTAEVVAKRYGISRDVQDEYSLQSQQRTARAQNEGFFAGELAPMDVTRGIIDKATKKIAGEEQATLSGDECNRPNTTIEALASLKPYFDPDSGQGSVTAGNSSQLSDGASATLVMSRKRAEELNIPYKLVFRGFVTSGCEPDEMGIGPVFAIPKLLKNNGLTMDDIDVWELNEAFAVQVVYCRDRLGIPNETLNVNGGSISIGHPFGMTGSRMVGTLANEMQRRKAKYGVVTMCVGGGQGAAGLFEGVW